MRNVVTAILGGGQGTRLWPLTRDRAKPAVPVGGKFRLIDIPISNSLHAGIRRIFVLTQFNSASLHQHIAQTYRFDVFSAGFVNILAAEQSLENRDWYQGTADAVRQNLDRLTYLDPSEVLVLSGDQLYLMDMRSFVQFHREKKAGLTVAVKPVDRKQAKGLGIMRLDEKGRIVEFVEKPQEEEELDRLTLSADRLSELGFSIDGDEALLASMGIYVFASGELKTLLRGNTDHDFGKEVIPKAIHGTDVYAFGYEGYWQDIGTIGAFHAANLELALPLPPLNLYSRDYPIFTHPRFLPGLKIHDCTVQHSLLCDGSILTGADIRRSVFGIRSVVRRGTVVEDSVVMGANVYGVEEKAKNHVPIGIGQDCVIRNAILDRNVRLGDGVKLINAEGLEHADGENYCIRNGVVVIPSDVEVAPGTVI